MSCALLEATAPTEVDASGEQQNEYDDQQDVKHGQDVPGSKRFETLRACEWRQRLGQLVDRPHRISID